MPTQHEVCAFYTLYYMPSAAEVLDVTKFDTWILASRLWFMRSAAEVLDVTIFEF